MFWFSQNPRKKAKRIDLCRSVRQANVTGCLAVAERASCRVR